MPKKLKIHPNERVDLPDFEYGTSQYSADLQAKQNQYLIAGKKPSALSGFRVEIADQATEPGKITIYNGHILDRSGVHVNSESSPIDSRSVTLVGPSTTFYVEIQYNESESDVDARAFWDETFDNSGTLPDGREVSINVSTRVTPDWSIVTPVSTTAFESTGTPSSTKIPVLQISTNSSNEIDAVANTSLVEVSFATKLEQDYASGVTSIRVIDSSLFPTSGTMVIGQGLGTAETVTITNNDRANNILSFSPATSSAHSLGEIVRNTSSTGRFVRQRTSPTAVHIDKVSRLFEGNEYRGAAIIASKEATGSRESVDIASLRDYVDTLSAQLRELKFGSMRPDTSSGTPPTTFSSTRWFDYAGSLQGTRTAEVTIGNGTDSFGDFNGTSQAVFSSAVAALDATEGGVIYVKEGDYTFASTVTVDRPVRFVFSPSADIIGNTASLFTISSLGRVEFLGLQTTPGSSSNRKITASGVSGTIYLFNSSLGAVNLSSWSSGGTLYLDQVTLSSSLETNVTLHASAAVSVYARNCSLSSSANSLGNLVGRTTLSRFSDCSFSSTGTGGYLWYCDAAGSNIDNVVFDNCIWTVSDGVTPIYVRGTTARMIEFRSCSFNVTMSNYGVVCDIDGSSLDGPIYLTDCRISASIGNTTSSNLGVLFKIRSLVAKNCLTVGSAAQYLVHYDLQAGSTASLASIESCSISAFHIGVSISRSNATVTNCNIVSNNSSASATGVLIGDTLTGVKILDNSISIIGNGVDTKGIAFGNSPVVISGNSVETTSSSGSTTYGIFADETDLVSFSITNNNIYGVTSTSGSHASILVAGTDSLSGVIAGNTISMTGGSGTSSRWGILASGSGFVSDREDFLTIANNTVSFVSSGEENLAAIEVADVAAASIIGNSITFGVSEVVTLLFKVDGIRASGDFMTISGNNITASEGASFLIRVDTDGFGSAPSEIVISNNSLKESADTFGGSILFESSAGSEGRVSISGNIIRTNKADVSSLFSFRTGILAQLGHALKGLRICGNTILENSFHDSNRLIWVSGNTGTPPTNVVVSDNILVGATASADKASDEHAAITIVAANYVVCSNNSVTNWGSSSYDATAIYMDDCGFVALNGNACQPTKSSIGMNHIIIDSGCQSGIAIGNIVGGLSVAGGITLPGTFVTSANKTSST